VKLRGLYLSKKVATLAESGNMTRRMGSEGESGLRALACAHLISSAKFDYETDGLGRGWYVDDVTVENIVEKSCLKVPEKPSLAAELDQNKVEQHRI
jgi:L-alanine-DL-glutamate epimerase-like enolase superfamily enzyme